MPNDKERSKRACVNQNDTSQDDALLARLLTRTERDPVRGCLRFKGALTGNGYGYVSYSGGMEYVHRLIAMLFHELDLTDGRVVRHTCDTPACCNPAHLLVGTQKDNMQDAAARGRMTGKKLNETQVAVIKYKLALGLTHRSPALENGVSTTAIGQIARRETWKTVAAAQPPVDLSASRVQEGE